MNLIYLLAWNDPKCNPEQVQYMLGQKPQSYSRRVTLGPMVETDQTRKGRAEVRSNCYGGAGQGESDYWFWDDVGHGRQGAGVLMYWSGPTDSYPRTPAISTPPEPANTGSLQHNHISPLPSSYTLSPFTMYLFAYS